MSSEPSTGDGGPQAMKRVQFKLLLTVGFAPEHQNYRVGDSMICSGSCYPAY